MQAETGYTFTSGKNEVFPKTKFPLTQLNSPLGSPLKAFPFKAGKMTRETSRLMNMTDTSFFKQPKIDEGVTARS